MSFLSLRILTPSQTVPRPSSIYNCRISRVTHRNIVQFSFSVICDFFGQNSTYLRVSNKYMLICRYCLLFLWEYNRNWKNIHFQHMRFPPLFIIQRKYHICKFSKTKLSTVSTLFVKTKINN